jgi:hypothetical protein
MPMSETKQMMLFGSTATSFVAEWLAKVETWASHKEVELNTLNPAA